MTLYVPPHFKIEDPAELMAFIERYAGTLSPARNRACT
jgi:hypothetical protein